MFPRAAEEPVREVFFRPGFNDARKAAVLPAPEASTRTFRAAIMVAKLREMRVGGGLGEFSMARNEAVVSQICCVAFGKSEVRSFS